MIFPDWGETPKAAERTALPLYTEWAVDWDTGSLSLRDGQPYTVTGDQALRIWVRCALHPENQRFFLTAHSHRYGNELSGLVGLCPEPGILESLLRRTIREALLASPYIEAVDGFTFAQKGSRMEVRFTVHTVYDEFTQKTEVVIG